MGKILDNDLEGGIHYAATEFSEWIRLGIDVYVPH